MLFELPGSIVNRQKKCSKMFIPFFRHHLETFSLGPHYTSPPPGDLGVHSCWKNTEHGIKMEHFYTSIDKQ